MARYNKGDITPTGWVIVEVKKGWYRTYHPSNVTATCSQELATTSMRWHWMHSNEDQQTKRASK